MLINAKIESVAVVNDHYDAVVYDYSVRSSPLVKGAVVLSSYMCDGLDDAMPLVSLQGYLFPTRDEAVSVALEMARMAYNDLAEGYRQEGMEPIGLDLREITVI